MIKAVLSIISRDIKSDIRNRSQILMIPLFFILTVIIYPLSIGSDTNILSMIAPSILIVSALFSSLTAIERLFTNDINDGTFEAIILCPVPFSAVISAKIFTHWLLTGLPVAIISPILAMMLHVDFNISIMIFGVICLVTILFSLLGALTSSITINSKKGSVLLALLSIPLFIPVLIFGAGAIDLAIIGGFDNSLVPILFLGAFTAFLMPVVPIICSIILKWQME